MESPMNSIGFSTVETEREMQELIKKILEQPTSQSAVKIDEKKIVAEYRMQFAESTYVMVRVEVDKTNKESKMMVRQCEPCVSATNNMEVREIEVEEVDNDQTYYVICEHEDTSMQIIFWLQNAVEYLQNTGSDKVYKGINVSGLALEGTIILPVEKDEQEIIAQREERDKLKKILDEMKRGDVEARIRLEQEERELDNQLKERLKQEDFLSIMSGYFIPTTLEDGVYAVLGEVLAFEQKTNKMTNEQFYVFKLDVNDMILEVLINTKDLIGMPSIGMRFLGTCWMQGRLIIE